jgi:PAS domain S-box-containing protein
MKDSDKSKHELIKELTQLRRKLAKLEPARPAKKSSKSSGIRLDFDNAKQLFDSFMNETPVVAFIHDDQMRQLYVNKEYERVFRVKASAVIGKRYDQIFAPEIAKQLRLHSQQVWKAGKPLEFVEHVPTNGDAYHHWLVIKFPIKSPSGDRLTGGVAVDITERYQAQEALNLIAAVTSSATVSSTIEEITRRTLEAVCKVKGWELGQAWFPSSDEKELLCSPAWYAKSTRKVANFHKASLQLKLKKGGCLPGQVWKRKEPIWMRDFGKRNLPRSQAALESNLGAAFAMPILFDTKVIAVFEFFDRQVRQPDPQLLGAINELGANIGLVLERKRSELALKSTMDMFDSFMKYSPAIAFMLNDQLQLVYVNEPFERTFNTTIQKVRGKTAKDLFPPATAQKFQETDMLVLKTGESMRYLDTAPTPNGDLHHWLTFKFPLVDSIGRTFVGGVAIDISERINAEHALRTQQEEQQIIFDSVPAMIWFKDKHNRILRVNDRVAELLGLPKEQIEGYSTCDLYPSMAEKYHLDDLEVIESGIPKFGIIEEMETADLGTRWVSTDKIPYRNEKGEVIGVVVFAVDITERKTAEVALKTAHDQLESKVDERTRELAEANIFFALSLDLLCIAGIDGYFKRLNPAWESALGYSMLELLSRPYLDFVHPDDRQKTLSAGDQVKSGVDVVNFENRYVCKDGSIKWFLWSATIRVGSNMIYAVAHDITERKETEQTIHKLNVNLEHRVIELAAVNQELQSLTQKLELAYDQALESSNLKSEFVANISHEIRTPISGVIGMSELILKTQLNPDQRNLALTIHESAQSLLSIINDILDFSKMEAGKVDLEMINFSPLTVVEGTAELIRHKAKEKGLSLMTFIDPKIPSWLKGDPVRLKQVLLNLADNAIKFTSSGDVVIRAVLQNEDDDIVNISFSVTDTGIGLSNSARDRLFQPFVQADGSTTRKYGGTGLGLSISKRLVHLMEGEIGVESREQSGSTFWFNISFGRSNREAISASAQMLVNYYQLNKVKVLVVEDSASASDIIHSYLTTAGLKADTKANQVEALEALRKALRSGHPYDAVIVDLSASPEAPLEFASKVQADQNLSQTKLVAVVPTEEPASTEQLLSHGYASWIVKPVRQTALIDVVAKGIGRTVGLTTIADDAMDLRQLDPSGGHLNSAATLTSMADKLILLAEDNPVLRDLAVRQLEKLGLKTQSVSNGREAVEAVQTTNFALILMDCQMPEMDGFEATACIRDLGQQDCRKIPIIAMTASAMPGDRENCLNAGMNDYLSKPVSLDALRQTLERWLLDPSEALARQDTLSYTTFDEAEQSPVDQPIDLESLKRIYGEQALPEILELFVGEASGLLEALKAASKQQDMRKLGTVAHQLKGLASVVCAGPMTKLCVELAVSASSAEWASIETLSTLLDNAFESVKALIDPYRKD